MCWRSADTVFFMHAEQLQRQSPAVWESGSLIYASIHLLSRIWAGWVTIAAKQTLARGYSGVIQLYTCKDGGQPSHAGIFYERCIQGVDSCDPPSACYFPLLLSDVIAFITDTSVTEEAGSLSLGTLPPRPPRPTQPHSVSLAGSLKAEGLCADVPGERPAPSALGEHVVWECLRWHSFKLSSHTACWRLSLLDDNAETLLPQKGAFSGWGDTGNHVYSPRGQTGETNLNKE